jgi:uncharacterized protein YukE
MTKINVDIDALKRIQNTIWNKKFELSGIVTNLSACVNEISPLWIAPSYTEFETNYETWVTEAKAIVAELDRINAGLQAAIEEAERVDRTFGLNNP